MPTTTRQNILDFLAAFPDRRVWIDEEAQKTEGEHDAGVLFDPVIDDDGEGAAYHVEQDMTLPMLNAIQTFLKVDDLGSYLDDGGDDYLFEAFGRGFQVSLYYYDVTGNRQETGMDSRTVRVVASLEPDPQWDEDNEDSPLAMTWTQGRHYRFAA
jgi:hypothetical protein